MPPVLLALVIFEIGSPAYARGGMGHDPSIYTSQMLNVRKPSDKPRR
jgi:hypothetical protein